MPFYKVVGKDWTEGYKDGDVVSIDQEAAKVALTEGRLRPITNLDIVRDMVRHGIELDEFEIADIPDILNHIGEKYFFISSDRAGYLVKNIEKVTSQAKLPMVSDEERVEIIMLVIGNDRFEAIRCIEGLMRCRYPFKITIYENSLNSMNTAKIWNKLIRESTCGYVMLIDSDAIPFGDFLTPLIDVLNRHPDAAVVCPVADQTAVPDYQRIPQKDKDEFVPGLDHGSGFCMLFRKSIFEKVGFFDEDFVFYGQDTDWMERVVDSDYNIYIVPRSLVHHGTDTQGSTSSMRLKEEGKFDFMLDQTYSQFLWRMKSYIRKNVKLKQGGLT